MRETKLTIDLLPYATERQAEYLNAYLEHGGYEQAAAALGTTKQGVHQGLQRLLVVAAKAGYAPGHFDNGVAPGYAMGKVTIQRGADGEVQRVWERQSPDAERQREAMQAVVDALREEIKPVPALPMPKGPLAEQLLNCYILTDHHLGAMAWGEESGANWDIKIAEDLMVAWFAEAIAQAPNAKLGVFAQLGDFLHWDGIDAVTPASKHLLDADTRFQKVIRVAIKVVRRVIAMLLLKHEKVHVLMAEGNHDTSSSMWLREMLSTMYEDEPRITVDVSPDPYYCIEHGKTALYFHHGHKKRLDGLETVFLAKFREVYGRTQHGYAHTGHLHHNVTKEFNTMTLEQHRTLAAPDAYASRGGWMSGRDSKVISYHKEYGEVGRVTVSVDMVRAVTGQSFGKV